MKAAKTKHQWKVFELWIAGLSLLFVAGIIATTLIAVHLRNSALKSSTPPTSASAPAATTFPGYKGYTVRGNTIYGQDGKPHLFKGLNRPSLEWSPTGDHLSQADYGLMASWKANVIRLPLNEKFWNEDVQNYQATVAQQVQSINGLGMDVILDLHWSDGGNTANQADQYNMGDADSVTFWKSVAAKYKDNPHVLFELYNEPRNIDWNVWLHGGQTSDDKHGAYKVVGMQQLYDAVRSSGAKNLVAVGGINWAFDDSEVKTYAISGGKNIIYATHPYDFSGKNTEADWQKAFGNLSAHSPVIMTEFGDFNCSQDLYKNMLDYAGQHNISWTAWGWYVGDCNFPALITDWNGTPSASGQVVKDYLSR